MRRRFTAAIGIAALAGLSVWTVATASAKEPTVAGYVEQVLLSPGNLIVHAKLDTGAKNSSINATEPSTFERGGVRWVRFRITNRKGKSHTFERPVKRIAKIKRSGTKTEERPVIELGICLGDVYKVAEVNLKNRAGMNYQMLIGRTFMASDVLVNSDGEYLTKPNCKVLPSGG